VQLFEGNVIVTFATVADCLLSLGIGARGRSSKTLDALLTQMHIDETDFLPCNSATHCAK
jgi:hypothetical protein